MQNTTFETRELDVRVCDTNVVTLLLITLSYVSVYYILSQLTHQHNSEPTPSLSIISLTSLTSLFILQPEDHRPMWYMHTITGEHRY